MTNQKKNNNATNCPKMGGWKWRIGSEVVRHPKSNPRVVFSRFKTYWSVHLLLLCVTQRRIWFRKPRGPHEIKIRSPWFAVHKLLKKVNGPGTKCKMHFLWYWNLIISSFNQILTFKTSPMAPLAIGSLISFLFRYPIFYNSHYIFCVTQCRIWHQKSWGPHEIKVCSPFSDEFPRKFK